MSPDTREKLTQVRALLDDLAKIPEVETDPEVSEETLEGIAYLRLALAADGIGPQVDDEAEEAELDDGVPANSDETTFEDVDTEAF